VSEERAKLVGIIAVAVCIVIVIALWLLVFNGATT